MTLASRYGFDVEDARRHLSTLSTSRVKMIPMLDGKKVKRAATSYLLYSNAERPALQSANPSLRVTDLAKLLGASWKALAPAEKQKYEALAAADKARYEDELSRAEMVPEPGKKSRQPSAPAPRPALAEPSSTDDAPPAPTLSLPDPPAKAKAKAGSLLKTVLPYCGQTLAGSCQAIRKNHGLYTQCTMPRLGGETLCKTCHAQLQKRGSLAYGVIESRQDMLSEKRLVATRYATVMRKLNISREKAEAAAASLGWTIPEQEFVEEQTKARGRPKKSSVDPTVSSSDESAPESEEQPKAQKKKKKAGRPKGNKKEVVSSAADGDDLISALIAQAEARDASEASSGEDVAAFIPEDAEEEEHEDVVAFEWDGVQYWRGKDGTLYDPETQEAVGKWNESSSSVEPLPMA
tara:strand:+ start:252 stop:1472 length:1221 start_codon:yes stop_codon:yes gene_type:complete